MVISRASEPLEQEKSKKNYSHARGTSWRRQRAPGNQDHVIRSEDLGGIFSLRLPAYSGSKRSLSLTSIRRSCKAKLDKSNNQHSVQLIYWYACQRPNLAQIYNQLIQSITGPHLTSCNNINCVTFINFCIFQTHNRLNYFIFLCPIRNTNELQDDITRWSMVKYKS